MARRVAIGSAVLALGFFLGGAPSGFADDPPAVTVTVVQTVQGRYQGWTARTWARHAVQARRDANARGRTIRRLRRTLVHSATVTEALALARIVYHVDLGRRVRCESHGSPTAHNRSGASGLLQFLPSTWASTPFGGLSVWSPYAAALAGGWMIRAGRSSEWSCSL